MKKITEIVFICVSLSMVVVLGSCGKREETDPKNPNKEVIVEKETDTKAEEEPIEGKKEEPLTAQVIIPFESGYSFNSDRSNPDDIYDATGFVSITDVIPDAILDIRYYSTYNFVGDRINGYEEPIALLSKEAAIALKQVSDELRGQGYLLKIFDAYRPQIAVEHFVAWASDVNDTRMKPYFYPEIDKTKLFNSGYIAYRSGHSRGCTVDLTLFDMNTGKEVDMGGTFDYFGPLSHPSYTNITEQQYNNRMLLRNVMVKYGFRPCSTEWWDFTLIDEPYPKTYFSFPVSTDSISNNK